LAHIKLGEYYYKKGDIPSAIKNYIRTRDYCTQSEHIIEMCFDNIKVYLDEGNHSPVIQTYIARAETTANMPDKVNTTSKLKCCRALAFLGGSDANRYRNVANTLTEVVFDSNPFFNDIMSSNDVAIYGGLCGLVSYDRRQLQSNILNNANFKNFLSLEPGLYELVEAFYHSKYATCLELLEKYKNSMSLDVHLQPHILTLVQLVREKAIVQYCIPYSTIDMKKMAVSFNMTVDHLEEDLVVLIGKKEKISARIDSHEKVKWNWNTHHVVMFNLI
jgi:COP9 signalosome complex subunit 1